VPTITISANEKVLTLYDRIKSNPDCFGYCVVENDIPIGIITKEKFALKLSGYFGFTLHQNKLVSDLMDSDFLTVDFKTPIGFVSSLAMSRSNDSLYDFIIVTQSERYLGTVTIKDLLQRTTELEVSAAKHQNPLTGLPGNILIEQELDQCISYGGDYTVAYLDIDNFKAYNDVYGFEKGDLIIKTLANVLRDFSMNHQFIGHIGGDDFVVVLRKYVTPDYFDRILMQFGHEIIQYYHQSDIERGFIVSTNRHGKTEKFPITSLTCVVIDNSDQSFNNAYEISETLALLKKKAKQSNIKNKLK
jgi:GGDEF domain-containing protein